MLLTFYSPASTFLRSLDVVFACRRVTMYGGRFGGWRVMGKWISSALARSIGAVGIVGVLAGVGMSSGASVSAQSSTNWTVYHGDPAGTGMSSALRAVDTAHRAWTSPTLNGELYGEPLVYNNRVYVATENDYAYALSAANGRVVWSRHLATPVPSSDLPCGDISPTVGVTGTPVIDPSRNEIYFVADELVGGGSEHKLVGLNTTSGALELSERIDPSGSVPSALLQRTGLNLTDGRVVFGMGGNYGDCASYRGRVGSVAESGSTPLFFTVDARGGDSQGAVWMGARPPSSMRTATSGWARATDRYTRIPSPTMMATRRSISRRRCT